MAEFFSSNLVLLAVGVGVITIIRHLAVSGGSFRATYGRKLDTLLQLRVRQGPATITLRLLLIANPRFPQALRQSGLGYIHRLPLPAPVVEGLPSLLREAVRQSSQFPAERKLIGRVGHRERSVWGEVAVTATGDSEFPVWLKVKPWAPMRRVIAAYRLELHQASSLADLMDHGRELLEPDEPNHPGIFR